MSRTAFQSSIPGDAENKDAVTDWSDDPTSQRFLLSCHIVQSIDDVSLIRIFPTSLLPQVKANSPLELTPNSLDHESPQSLESDTVHAWVQSVARMLNQQWPQRGVAAADGSSTTNETDSDLSGLAYYRNMIVHHAPTSSAHYGLACSYLLIRHGGQNKNYQSKQDNSDLSDTDNQTTHILHSSDRDGYDVPPQPVGHGRLTECFESAGGDAAAATYVIIDEGHRGNGYGKILMTLLEREAKRLGYHFVYLWTQTAADFYTQHCGYRECHRVSLRRQCLRSLDAYQVQNLEAVLQQRGRHRLYGGVVHDNDETTTGKHQQDSQDGSVISHTSRQGRPMKKMETILLPPDSKNSSTDQVQNDDIWLRKRLVEHVGSALISVEDRWKEIEEFVVASSSTLSQSLPFASHQWYYRWNPTVPWQPQIGPSCGLVALRMVREYYHQFDDSQGVSNQKEDSSRDHSAGTDETTNWDKNKNDDQKSSLVSNEQELNEKSENRIIKFPSLLQQAQERGYTQDGEIFDATHLTDLAVNVCDIANSRSRTVEMDLVTVYDIDSTIRDGGLWILPYDSNPRTKLPTKQLGKHAHWGIIVGILVCCYCEATASGSCVLEHHFMGQDEDGEELSLSSSMKQNENEIHQHPIMSLPTTGPTSILPLEELVGERLGQQQCLSNDGRCRAFLCVQHSLSPVWAIAPIEEWMESNQQLASVDDDRFKLSMKSGLNLKGKIIRISVDS
jgi:hypothetical protein